MTHFQSLDFTLAFANSPQLDFHFCWNHQYFFNFHLFIYFDFKQLLFLSCFAAFVLVGENM